MKAYVLRGIGQLDFTEVPMPKPKSGWAIVQVKAGLTYREFFRQGRIIFLRFPAMNLPAG